MRICVRLPTKWPCTIQGEVTHLSEQVQILLARVYELEAAADQAGDVDHVQQLRQRDARVQELEERLQKLTTTLEDEKRAHISALELVQVTLRLSRLRVVSANGRLTWR